MSEVLLTTQVGSLPKPPYITKARAQFKKGDIGLEGLRELEKKAIREAIQMQEEIGIDILVDGEFYRGDMVEYFAEQLTGFKISGLVRSYGNRYYHKPIIADKVKWEKPLTVDWFEFAQSLTSKPVKAILTGPYTMVDWSFDEYHPNRRSAVLDMTNFIREEVKALEAAGAQYIQIDEPALSVRPEEIDLAIEAMGIVTKGIHAKTLTHICYGTFERIYPKLLEMPVDQIDLEMANSKYDMLELFKKYPFTKEIGLGVVDVHSHRLESVEEVVNGIKKALEVLKPEQIYPDPDCGLKTRTWDEAKAKLEVIVKGRNIVRSELGL